MSYAWIDIQTTGLTIEVLIRRKSDMAVWDGSAWKDVATELTDTDLEACAIAAVEEKTKTDLTTTGYKVDIPAGVTVESEIFGYNGGYTAGDARTWVGDYLVGNDSILAYDPPTKDEMDSAFTTLKGATWSADTDTIEDIRNQVGDLYHADIQVAIDGTNSQDEYTVAWFKNGVRITSGITVPQLQVVKRADGTDLIAATDLTEIGSTHTWKYDESSDRLTNGEAALAIVTATIDGSSREFAKVVGRDSSA